MLSDSYEEELVEFSGEETIIVTYANEPGSKKMADTVIELIRQMSIVENVECGSVNVVLSDDNFLQELNSKYRDLNEPTDVLSFSLADTAENKIEGDIYISLQRAATQAKEVGDSVEKEVYRLAVHGYLHLCGWEHEDDVSLRSMIELGEKQIEMVLLRKGIGN